MKVTVNSNEFEIPDEFSFVDFSNNQFNKAFEQIFLSTTDLFIQGRAGAGKSLLIKMASQMLKQTIVLSTTGVTAMALTNDNITAHTIHSFMQIAPAEILDNNTFSIFGKTRELLKRASCIIIDEASMMSNHLFDHMCEKILSIRNELPRFILFGDVMQLPPVIGTDNKIVKDFYHNRYNDKFMFFNSMWFKQLGFKTIMLRKSFRQDNADLADMLFQVGYNDHSQETLDYFNSRVMSINKYEQDHDEFMYLSPVNTSVNKINNDYIQTVSGKERLYIAEISKTWPKKKIVPDKEVLIKEGAQIMCTMNHYPEYNHGDNFHYRNGQIGVAEEVRNDEVVANIEGNRVIIGRTIVHSNELALDSHNNIISRSNGWYRQIDCKIAKAITVHKSQGKTLKNAYFVPGGWLPQGLVYVALSRITSLEGLGISRPLTMDDIKVNQEAFDFLEAGE
jgi:ATP-dependent exoDNAse (exonuclease V) alpha subunit